MTKISRALLIPVALASFSLMAQDYKTDVIDVTEAQLAAPYWQQSSMSQVLMPQSQISQFNQRLYQDNPYVHDPLKVASKLSKQDLLKKINKISSVPSSARFYADGSKLTKADFAKYQENTNKGDVKASNTVKYGLVTKRASLRSFPTRDRVFNKHMDTDLDRFQESGIFPGEPVAVLHHSKDGEWLLVQNYNYIAWMPADAVATASNGLVSDFVNAKDFLLVTGAKVKTNHVPQQPAVSQQQLDMGVKLPLMPVNDVDYQVYGQNPYASYVVQFPVRKSDGTLAIKPALVPRSADVSKTFLPFNKQNIVQQSFKFLGERYGWGHDYNGRDCTGFVGEIYKSFGFKMPRNSGQQGKSQYGENFNFDANTPAKEKLAVVNNMQVGDLIYIPGHVMMYLGKDKGQPYVIHDVKGLGYINKQGQFYKGTLNGVSVTPLLPLHLSKQTSYLDKIYNIKRIR